MSDNAATDEERELGRCWQRRVVEEGQWTGAASGEASGGGGEA